MKLKSGFVLHSLGSEHVVVAVEDRTREFRGMIRLNDTGAFLWKQLELGQPLEEALVKEYGISRELAVRAAEAFTRQLLDAGVLQ